VNGAVRDGKSPKGAHISLLSAHRRVAIWVFKKIFYDLAFKIPTSLQKMGGEFIVCNESVTTMFHLHLEYYTIIG